jgi:hypothetical protein
VSDRHDQPAAQGQSVTAEWLASMIRNYVEDDDFVSENGAVVVQTPGDPLTIIVLQKGGEHLMIQVNRAEVVIA